MEFAVRELTASDVDRIASVDGGTAWNPDRGMWQGYLAEQQRGRRVVLLATIGARPIGYGTLVWEPNYQPFRAAGIPEINNLVVAAHARGHGIASQLISRLEAVAKRAGRRAIGLGVGLYASYGPAQRLYVRLGYRPDGNGVTYRDEPLTPGTTVRVDDDLVLWLVKLL
jgi:GNAT superfamily N-acetyltransferase